MRRSRVSLHRRRLPFFALVIIAPLLLVPTRPARADLFATVTHAASGSPGIARYDNAGRFLGLIPAGGEAASGLDVDDAGRAYLATNTLGRGSFSQYSPPYTSGTGIPTQTLSMPGAVTTDDAGRAYVVGNGSSFVQDSRTGVFRFDPVSRAVTFIPAAAPATRAWGVAVSPAGDVFVSRVDSVPASSVAVERYSGATGAFLGTFIANAPQASGFEMEFGPDGNLYLGTRTGIDRYSGTTGAFIDTFVPAGAGGLAGVPDFDFGGDGLLYVNSRGTSSVLRFDAATGAFRDVFIAPDQYNRAEWIGGLGVLAVAVPEPTGLAVVLVGAGLLRRRPRG